MPNYVLLSRRDFIKRLNTYQYMTPAGARRALSKIKQLNDADREAGEAAIMRHFGGPKPKKRPESKPVVDLMLDALDARSLLLKNFTRQDRMKLLPLLRLAGMQETRHLNFFLGLE